MNYITYLINLDRATERLEIMKKEFEQCQMSFERFPAVDASNLEDYEYRIDNKYDRNLLNGEIGCYLSHVYVLERFLKTNNDFALIIEDDAKLAEDLKYSVEETLKQYKDLKEKHRWDVLKLQSNRPYIKIQEVKHTPYFIGACGTSIPITTIAAIWTREAAHKFLNKCLQPIPVIRRPIDCELQHPWEYKLLIYNLLPSPVSSFKFESQILLDLRKRKANLFKQIRYELRRLIPKYNYYISQHGFKKFYQQLILKKVTH